MNLTKKSLFILSFLLLTSGNHFLLAQTKTHSNKNIKTYLANEDYNRVLKENLKLYNDKKDDLTLNLIIGICYLNVNDDKTKALPYLEYVQKSGKYDNDLLLYLGMAHMYNYDFDKAIEFFNEYKTKSANKKTDIADLLISNCENAKVLVKRPINVTFENLGKEINTVFPDYYPFVTKDERTMYFTTRRDATIGNVQSWQGYYTSDIYVSKVVNGQWTKAKNAGPIINTQEDEQCVYLSSDGKLMIVYIDDTKNSGDLFITSQGGKVKNFPKPIKLNEPINSDYSELEGCITSDGTMMIFASDKPGGIGQMDLYMSRKLPSGMWGTPINLGENVNSKLNEGFPVFDEINNVLYFASEGHFNMGGYDIFKSKYNPKTQKFESPINMGYPINTPENNMQFTLAGNARDGYISAYRKDGYGDLDIYKVIFNDVDVPVTVLKGAISCNDSSKNEINATIKVLDAKSKKEIDFRTINSKTGRFVFALEPGKYTLEIESPGFIRQTIEIPILDMADFVSEKEKNIFLLKEGTITTTVEPKKNTSPANKTNRVLKK